MNSHWTKIATAGAKCKGCGKELVYNKVYSTDKGLYCSKECSDADSG